MIDTQKLNLTFLEMYARDQFSGIILVKKRAETLYQFAIGEANRCHHVPHTLDTVFRIASISKMFVAVAVLQLIEQGKFDFETGVVQYLGLSGIKIPNNVTVFHLLTHTSGIADYFDENEHGQDEFGLLFRNKPNYTFRTPSDYLPLFVGQPPIFPAGEKFYYCGAGYILLGLMIEQAVGLTFVDYIRANIFDRIGLIKTDYYDFADVVENMAEGYVPVYAKIDEKKIIGWQRNIYTTSSVGAPDGGAYSTAEELISFFQALRAGQLLSPEMTKKMTSPHVPDWNDDEEMWEYGFANWFVTCQKSGKLTRFGHPGEEPGISCRMFYYPPQDVDVVVLANLGNCAGKVHADIYRAIVGDS